MISSVFLPGIGKATLCAVTKTHAPKPLRFVWHHILPQGCGGKTTKANTVSACDSCHYAIHILLYELAQNNGKLAEHSYLTGTSRHKVALAGYAAAAAAGTIGRIPNEGAIG